MEKAWRTWELGTAVLSSSMWTVACPRGRAEVIREPGQHGSALEVNGRGEDRAGSSAGLARAGEMVSWGRGGQESRF